MLIINYLYYGDKQNQYLKLAIIIPMRITPKNLIRPDLYSPQNNQTFIRLKDNPEDIIAIQLEQIVQNLRNYHPKSDVADIQLLKNGQKVEIKRYKQSAYWGQFQEGKRHGQGIMLYINGRIYQGNWVNNQRNGKGFQKFTNSSIYKGNYVNGKPEGCGRYEWQNGQVYEGQWKNGVKHGSGIWRGSKGDSYIGEWQEGKAEGYGVHTWTNGDRYEGQFKNCLKHGQGVQRFANGDTYKGMYEEGKPSGYGEYYWLSGSFFKGNFKGGLRNGQGVWKKGPGRSDKYEGQWLNDKKQGYGVFTSAQGNIYKGHYVNDLRQGFGEMVYIDGTSYRGNWKADQQIDIPEQQQSIEHDEDCQFFAPSKVYAEQYNIDEYQKHNDFLQNQLISQPMPLYRQPQRPSILKSASRNFRPRNITKISSMSEKSRLQGQGKSSLSKKMSTGTVAGKTNANATKQFQMTSSFFLYKIHGQEKNKQHINRRQVRTSGGSRGKNANIDEQLKYFARSKINSFSQLQ